MCNVCVDENVCVKFNIVLRLVHTKRLRHRLRNKRYGEGQNGCATHHCVHNSEDVVRCEQTFSGPLWLRIPGHTSPEDQNRVISGTIKRIDVLQK